MKEDGGSAFPIAGSATDEDLDLRFYGMTLRDYFAAKAMQGKLAGGGPVGTYEEEAEDCYRIADSMLEARK